MRFLIPRSRAGMLWRFFAAAVIVIGAGAATTAVAGLLQVQNLVAYISVNPGIHSKAIQLPAPGKPQTILLIGSDHRDGEPFRESNTDTILLVRLNAASSTINVLSIPRDLEVTVPGYSAPQKINAAYSEGGYNLLIKTIQQDVFPGFVPNHIVDTNFTGFSDLVDAIGCVYSDVDHRYYNNTDYTNYSSIDIQPGYQKLCGDNQSVSGALPFVRFRHTDTDIVRNARQQDFIRWAKDQYPIGKLVSNRARLLKIFGKHSTLDAELQTTDGLLNLFNLVLNSDGNQIKQIEFPAILPAAGVAGPSYVTAETNLERAAYARFMTPSKKSQSKAKSTPKSARGDKHAKLDIAGLTADVDDGRLQVAALDKVKMPIYFPKYILTGSVYCAAESGNCDDGSEPAAEYASSYPRQYEIPDQSGHKHAAYRMTIVINSVMGQYYGVQGTTWHDPPLLASPSGTRTINGRKLFLYADGGRLTTVAWHLGTNTYWISNTLTSAIPNSRMVAIAASMIKGRS